MDEAMYDGCKSESSKRKWVATTSARGGRRGPSPKATEEPNYN
jgi:hypothetical protein